MSLPKLIAADMDGTLLDSSHRLAPGFEALLDTLLSRGTVFVAASGRQYQNMIRFFPKHLDKIWLIAENGGFVYEGTKLRLAHRIPEAQITAALEEIAKIPTAEPILCGARSAYMTPRAPEHEADARNFYENCLVCANPRETAGDDALCKIAIYDPEDAKGRILPTISNAPHGLTVALSGMRWVDLMPPGVSKGLGLRFIQKTLGIPPEESAAFGDYGNDLPLLEACGIACAMENAIPSVKAAATCICPSNDAYGVLKKISEWLL